jgi:KUP system potassium uptake protein
VLETVFHKKNNAPTPSQCIGAVSLIIWSLVLVVSVKYSVFIIKADNRGEGERERLASRRTVRSFTSMSLGGTFALCALLTKRSVRLGQTSKQMVNIISIVAASLLIGESTWLLSRVCTTTLLGSGDGALTPAVSVLSAVEGLALNAPNLHRWIVPITLLIIVLLFVCQQWGTSRIGSALVSLALAIVRYARVPLGNTFAPIMFIWFSSLFAIGIWRIRLSPVILHAFDPSQAIRYLIREKRDGFYQLGRAIAFRLGLVHTHSSCV